MHYIKYQSSQVKDERAQKGYFSHSISENKKQIKSHKGSYQSHHCYMHKQCDDHKSTIKIYVSIIN